MEGSMTPNQWEQKLEAIALAFQQIRLCKACVRAYRAIGFGDAEIRQLIFFETCKASECLEIRDVRLFVERTVRAINEAFDEPRPAVIGKGDAETERVRAEIRAHKAHALDSARLAVGEPATALSDPQSEPLPHAKEFHKTARFQTRLTNDQHTTEDF